STFNVDSEGMASNGAAYVKLPDKVRAALSESNESTVVVGFRPERLEMVSDPQQLPEQSHGVIAFTVDFTEELGSDTYLYSHLAGGEAGATSTAAPIAAQNAAEIVMRVTSNSQIRTGYFVFAVILPGVLHVFTSCNGARIN